MIRWTLPLAVLLIANPAHAADCASPAEPWAQASTVASAVLDNPEMASVTAGEAALLTLHPVGEVAYRSLPQGEGEAASFGGMVMITISTAGHWRVSIDRPAWIDLVSDAGPAQTVRFGPGAPCSGVRKAVTFDLHAGPHVLELSGSHDRQVGVLVEAVPAD